MIRPTCIVFCLLVGLVQCQTRFGTRATGDQLVYVQYREAESPTPADLLLHFTFDGSPTVNWISAVECSHHSDSSDTFTAIAIDGGLGEGHNFFEFSLAQKGATYHRSQCNYFGFYQA